MSCCYEDFEVQYKSTALNPAEVHIDSPYLLEMRVEMCAGEVMILDVLYLLTNSTYLKLE